MKAFFFVLAFSVAAPALACSSNLDCDVGARCEKEASSMYGVCVGGGYHSGAPKDSGEKPIGGDKAGNSCSFSSECGVGGTCLKAGYASTGTCTK